MDGAVRTWARSPPPRHSGSGRRSPPAAAALPLSPPSSRLHIRTVTPMPPLPSRPSCSRAPLSAASGWAGAHTQTDQDRRGGEREAGQEEEEACVREDPLLPLLLLRPPPRTHTPCFNWLKDSTPLRCATVRCLGQDPPPPFPLPPSLCSAFPASIPFFLFYAAVRCGARHGGHAPFLLPCSPPPAPPSLRSALPPSHSLRVSAAPHSRLVYPLATP